MLKLDIPNIPLNLIKVVPEKLLESTRVKMCILCGQEILLLFGGSFGPCKYTAKRMDDLSPYGQWGLQVY